MTGRTLDLAEVAARLQRQNCPVDPRSGDKDFLDVCRIINHDAPALLDLLTRVLPALCRLEDAAENLLANLEAQEDSAVLCAGVDESEAAVDGAKELRMALLAVPADLPEVPGEASCT